jgi:transposase
MSSPSHHIANTEWHTPVKAKVHTYFHDFGKSKHEISKELNITRSVVNDILSKPVRRQITYRSRPKILDPDEVQKMIQKACENYTTRIFTWEGLGAACDIEASARTIKRAMNEAGFHKCKACHHSFISTVGATKRVFWVDTDHRDEQSIEYWHDWNFSDEVTLTTGMQATKMVIRTVGDRHNPDCNSNQFRSDRASFSCWGFVGWYWKSPLVFLEDHGKRGGFTQEDYAEQVIDAVVGPYFAKSKFFVNVSPILYEDGNSAHGLAGTRPHNPPSEAKKRWNITYVASPPSSPDFNIIENIWRIIKSRIKAYPRPITRLDDLKEAVQKEWDRITISDIRKLVLTMKDRMKQAKERHGYATKY